MNNNEELVRLSQLNYFNLCEYLKKKYGNVPGDYFRNEKCKVVNQTIKRTKEGLFVHHIFDK